MYLCTIFCFWWVVAYRCLCFICCCCCKKKSKKSKPNAESTNEDDPKKAMLDAPLQDQMEKGILLKDNFIDFPRAWRERYCIMAFWMNFSLALGALTCFTCPGVLCGIFGGAFYTCRCCQPKKEGAGKKASTVIYITALCAIFFDFLCAATLFALVVYYELTTCTFSVSICSLRTAFELAFCVLAILLIIHALCALNTFVSMRDCYYDIIREKVLEAKVRDLAKLKFEEKYRRYKRQKKSKMDIKSRNVSLIENEDEDDEFEEPGGATGGKDQIKDKDKPVSGLDDDDDDDDDNDNDNGPHSSSRLINQSENKI